jgi:hypothetical protein
VAPRIAPVAASAPGLVTQACGYAEMKSVVDAEWKTIWASITARQRARRLSAADLEKMLVTCGRSSLLEEAQRTQVELEAGWRKRAYLFVEEGSSARTCSTIRAALETKLGETPIVLASAFRKLAPTDGAGTITCIAHAGGTNYTRAGSGLFAPSKAFVPEWASADLSVKSRGGRSSLDGKHSTRAKSQSAPGSMLSTGQACSICDAAQASIDESLRTQVASLPAFSKK